jgi:hypothetical protein
MPFDHYQPVDSKLEQQLSSNLKRFFHSPNLSLNLRIRPSGSYFLCETIFLLETICLAGGNIVIILVPRKTIEK